MVDLVRSRVVWLLVLAVSAVLTVRVLGLTLGTLGFLITSAIYGVAIGQVIGLTLFGVCTMAATVGGAMPLIGKAIRVDPAVFSNPFISTFCDATGLIMYFLIARSVLHL